MSLPPQSIVFEAAIINVNIDPIACLTCTLGNPHAALEGYCITTSSDMIVDSCPTPHERIDELPVRWDMAHKEPRNVGAEITKPHMLTIFWSGLVRALVSRQFGCWSLPTATCPEPKKK